MEIREFQQLIERIYFDRDKARGVGGTFMWFAEEVGELATELRQNKDPAALAREFADVLAWLCTLASISGIDMEDAIQKYSRGCPPLPQHPLHLLRKNLTARVAENAMKQHVVIDAMILALHHNPPQSTGGLFDVQPLWPDEHILIHKSGG